MTFLREMYRKLRDAWPPNRVAVAITPFFTLISGAISGYVATWVAAHFPGLPPLDPIWLAGIFTAFGVSAAVSAFLAMRKFLDGWMQYEAMLADPDLEPLARVPMGSAPDDDFLLSQPTDIEPSDATDE